LKAFSSDDKLLTFLVHEGVVKVVDEVVDEGLAFVDMVGKDEAEIG
jgi:hypothetical protein